MAPPVEAVEAAKEAGAAAGMAAARTVGEGTEEVVVTWATATRWGMDFEAVAFQEQRREAVVCADAPAHDS